MSRVLSWTGVLLVLAIILIVNYLFGLFRTRIDFTEDKLYTLSDGTVEIIKNLDTPVAIRYYRTGDREMVPEQMELYMDRVEDILREYQKRAADDMLQVELLDPEPNSDAEVAALQAGIGKVSENIVDAFYNGLEVQCLDKKVTLPFLSPREEELLEYEISRAIAEVTAPKKPAVAIMTDEPIRGGPSNPMNPMAGMSEGWVLPQILERDYDLEVLPLSTDKIEDEIDLVILVHPKEISEAAEYALDQFVLRGGKLIAYVDPKFYFGQSAQPTPGQFGAMGGNSSTLNKLFSAWGVSFTTSQVVADTKYMMTLTDQRRRQIEEPRVLGLNEEAISKDQPASASLQNLLLWEAGAFTGSPSPGLTKSTLIHSSENSQLVAPSMPFGGSSDAEKIIAGFKPDGKQYDLAIMLQGTFKTAFPDGKPSTDPDEEEEEGEEDEEGEDEASADDEEAAEADEKEAAPLKESVGENAVVLIGDVDMIYDRTYLQQLGSAMFMSNSNVVLLQNLLEQLGGNSNLIKIRSRVAAQRSFTKIREMDEAAEAKYRARLQELQEEIDAAQRDLAQISQKGQGNEAFNLDPEAQQARQRIYQTLSKAKEEYRQLELTKRKDKEALKTKLKLLNILGVPLIVVCIGLALAVVRKVKTAAK